MKRDLKEKLIGEFIQLIQKNLLVRDLIIEGLSLARTQREEFNSVIQNGKGKIDANFQGRMVIEKNIGGPGSAWKNTL